MITMHMTMRVHPANRGKHPTTLSHHPKPHPLCPHQPHTRPYTPRFPPQQPYSRTHVAAQSSAAPSTPTTPSSPEPTVDPTPIIDPQELCQFITDELQGCFKGGRGITQSRYTSDFVFRDPLVTLPPGPQAHQLQLDAFKTFFDVKFVVFSCAQNATDPYTFDVRWSMRCVLRLAPWRPPVQITGASVITVDPLTGRLASQRDIWDAVADIPAPSVRVAVDGWFWVGRLVDGSACGWVDVCVAGIRLQTRRTCVPCVCVFMVTRRWKHMCILYNS